MLSEVELKVACVSFYLPTVTVSLHEIGTDGLPDTTVLASVDMGGGALPERGSDAGPVSFPFHLPVVRGEKLAIVVDASAPLDFYASCTVANSYDYFFSDPYVNGASYVTSDDWPDWHRPTLEASDLFFKTFVDADVDYHPASLCRFQTADGDDNDWVPADVPACQCLRDPTLAYQRCGFRLPAAIVIGEWPLDVTPKVPARWSVQPLVDPGTPTYIDLKSLTGGLKGPTVKIDAREPMYSNSVETRYQADTADALDRTLVTIKLGDRSYRFQSIRLPRK